MKGRGERERREENNQKIQLDKRREEQMKTRSVGERVWPFSLQNYFSFFFLTGTTTTTQTHTEIMQRSRLTFCLQIFFCSTLRPPFFFSC
jgi:hypothetical protein